MSPVDGFEAFADLLPEAMLLVDGQGIVRDANRACAAFLRLPRASVVGQRLADLAAGDPGTATELVRAASRTRSLTPGNLRFRTAAGATADCRCEGALYRAATATSPALVLLRISPRAAAVNPFVALNLRITELSREVTRRRAAEIALQAESDRLRVTLASIGDAVIATDSDGKVTLMNPVAETLTGWRIAEAAGRPLESVFTIINEFSREPVENPVTHVLREGRIVGLANHTMLISKDGTERPIADSGAPIRDEGGRLVGVVLVFHDITERYAMERELHGKTLKLQEADRRKDDFLSMLAHELRNPLAPLTTGVHLLQKSADSPERVLKTAAMMGRQLGHMTRLVDDLLDVARLTRGRIELRRALVPLRDVLAQAVEVSRPLIEARGHRLVLGAIPDVQVDADPTRLVQVFGNLLNNSAKYTPTGGEIELTSVAEPGALRVAVRDSGEGMDGALLPHVFDLFTQAHRSLDRSQGGLGIGLTVVRAIVEMHGGQVRAHSAGIGQGSTFEVRLPVATADVRDADAVSDGTAAQAHPAGVRVLVVDDNVDAAESLGSVVSAWGYEVSTAYEATDAMEQFEALRPRIVLLDIGMPGMDGYALARHFRTNTGPSGVCLVAVTGYGREEDRRLGSDAGFDEFMTKPVDLHELERVLLRSLPAA